MKIIILCAVIVTVLIQEASAEKYKNGSGLKCHFCMLPQNCKNLNPVTCAPHEDVCQRTHRNIVDPDPSKGVMVWERLCNTKQACEAKKKSNAKVSTVTCCATPLCNV